MEKTYSHTHTVLSSEAVNTLLPVGFRLPLAAHPSASDSASGSHCGFLKIDLLTYLHNSHFPGEAGLVGLALMT